MSKSCIIMDKETIRFDNAVFNELLSIGIEVEKSNISVVINGVTTQYAHHSNPTVSPEDWNDAKRELLQTYLLSQFQQQSTSLLKKNNKPFTIDDSVPLLEKYDDEILSKLKNHITKDNIWDYLYSSFIEHFSMDVSVAKPFVENIIEKFNVSVPTNKELCSIFYNKLYFNTAIYNDFLTQPLHVDSKRELTQFYFLVCCVREFKHCNFLTDSSNNKLIEIDPSILFIDNDTFQRIEYKLSKEIEQQEFFNYLRAVLDGVQFDKEYSQLVASKILPSIFTSLELNPTNELSVNTKKNFYFNTPMIENFLHSQLSDEVKRELVQIYFLYYYNKQYPLNYFSNISEVEPYLAKIEILLRGKISKDDYIRYISFLNELHPQFEEQSTVLFSIISSNFKIKSFKNDSLISYDKELEYNPFTLEKFLSESLTTESFQELVQAYFLIQCLKQFNISITNKQNKTIILSEDFKEILEYEEEIEEKIKNCEAKHFMFCIHNMKKEIFFSNDNDFIIIESILPSIIKSLCITDHRYYQDIIYFFDKTCRFQKKLCHEYLHSEHSDEIKRELTQTYFIAKYIELFPQSVANNIILHSSMNELKHYLVDIKNYLKENVSEAELDSYITILDDYIHILPKEKDILFDQLSIDLSAIEDPKFLVNDIISVISNTYNKEENKNITTLSSLIFNERICKKLLSKKLNSNSIRDLSQAYFCYQYFDKLGDNMVGKNNNLIEFKNIDKIEPYIESIIEKLNGVVKDEAFDSAINIITNGLTITEEQKINMTKSVLYPIKKNLGLTKPSLLKHLL